MPDSALPPGLRGKKHTDWPWPFSLIPRGATAFKWGKPKKLFGNQPLEGGIPKPIGQEKTWQVSYYPKAPLWAKLTGFAYYAAYSGKKGKDGMFRHFRLGTRFDDVDNYATIFSVATRKFTGDDSQDTST